MPPHTSCVLCNTRLKVRQRRPVNKFLKKYLRKNFLLECSDEDYICGKCSRQAYRSPKVCPPESQHQNDDVSSSQASPPSVKLNLKTATKSHAYCFICKKPGPRLIVVPQAIRTEIFITNNILITSESRCCPSHLNKNQDKFEPAVIKDLRTIDHIYLNRTAILELLSRARQAALSSTAKRVTFDNMDFYTDDDITNMTGLQKQHFVDLHECVGSSIRNTPARSSLTTLGLFLFKMKSGLSNKFLSTLFGLSRSSVRRAIHSVRQVLVSQFVPHNLGFSHITRHDVISNHTRVLAQTLFAENKEQVILVIDGTYIYINKSNNFQFQRRSYSIHKGRPLVKPMVIVTTTGYYISVLGPYFADSKNNDASILKHIFSRNIETIQSWVHPSDIFVVDRGFRDSVELLNELGIKAQIPAFMKKGEKQMSTEMANTSRLVTKVRWVVEAANARIKRFKYLDKTLPSNQVPYIGDYVRIVCAISNKYMEPINRTKDTEDDILVARRMLDRLKTTNDLQQMVEDNNLDRRSVKWQSISEAQISDFPHLDDTIMRILTLGTYQLKMSSNYIQEFVGDDCVIQLFRESEGLLRARMQSRHVSSKSYMIWIKYDSDHIQAWYCKCRAGARTVGTCSHVAALIWYLGQSRFDQDDYGVRDWGQYLEDAATVPETVDSSDSEDSYIEE